jgi:carbamoyltransferase
VRDGEIVAAAQQERFSRQKHDPRFPRQAINYCLEEAFVEPDDLDAIVFYDSPLLTFDRVMKSLLTVAPRGEEQWLQAAPSVLGVKLFTAEYIRRTLKTEAPVLFTQHHLSHAASAFYPSPFERAAILTMDGVGEWATTSISAGEDTEIRPLKEIHYPHSLGLLYSAFTYFCGFKVNSGEYKLMGLAPYGQPRYADRIREELISIKDDGSFRLNLDYFGYLDSTVMTNERFEALFEGPPREPESPITRREMDLAASVQDVLEEAVLKLARHAQEIVQAEDLCLAGGVALNCVANARLLNELPGRIWVQPAAGDAGGALGAALLASHRRFGVPRRVRPDGGDTQRGSYLGPAYSGAEVRALLDRYRAPYEVVEDGERVAAALAEGKVVGFFSGRMEFGPRALGARSIIGDPRSVDTQVKMNLKIKYRESFRPFAPSVLAERAHEYFDLCGESPYMLLIAPVREERRLSMDLSSFNEGDDDMLRVVRQPRSDIPAITHVDYSARLQTVRDEHPAYRSVLEAFARRTGVPVVVNTSFNVRGEPIVCSPEDAYLCFMNTEMDMLMMEDCVLLKEGQPPLPEERRRESAHELD